MFKKLFKKAEKNIEKATSKYMVEQVKWADLAAKYKVPFTDDAWDAGCPQILNPTAGPQPIKAEWGVVNVAPDKLQRFDQLGKVLYLMEAISKKEDTTNIKSRISELDVRGVVMAYNIAQKNDCENVMLANLIENLHHINLQASSQPTHIIGAIITNEMLLKSYIPAIYDMLFITQTPVLSVSTASKDEEQPGAPVKQDASLTGEDEGYPFDS